MHCLYGGYNLHRFSDALGLVIGAVIKSRLSNVSNSSQNANVMSLFCFHKVLFLLVELFNWGNTATELSLLFCKAGIRIILHCQYANINRCY